MKSLAVSITDATGVPSLPPDALHLTTEGVPDPTDESLALLEPLDDLEPVEAEEAADADAADEVVAPVAEVADETAPGFDPVRLYLRQMAQNGLLTREGEIAIAKRIEAGQLAMMRAAFSTPLALRWVLDLGEKVLGEVAVRDLVRDSPTGTPSRSTTAGAAGSSRR
jgi:RNA polymerase primary sigma factor